MMAIMKITLNPRMSLRHFKNCIYVLSVHILPSIRIPCLNSISRISINFILYTINLKTKLYTKAEDFFIRNELIPWIASYFDQDLG